MESVVIMTAIDDMKPPMRALVREYGYLIVQVLIADGHKDPFEMAELLEEWRRRRQEQWLETNHITRKTAQSIADAVQYRMAARQWRKHL
jgi:hypothetical protein